MSRKPKPKPQRSGESDFSFPAFREYLQAQYDAGDGLPVRCESRLAAAQEAVVNWRGIVADFWERARELGGAEHPPPPLPDIDSDAAAKSAIDQLMRWSWEAETKSGEQPADKDWILATEALNRLPFIRNGLRGLRRFATDNPSKLRMRPHPKTWTAATSERG